MFGLSKLRAGSRTPSVGPEIAYVRMAGADHDDPAGRLLAALLGTFAAAQSGGTPGETPSVPRSPEKQAVVKQHMKRERPPEAQSGGPITVEMTIPESVEPRSLPQDNITEVPATIYYHFLRAGGVIAVVEPESRRVIQIITNEGWARSDQRGTASLPRRLLQEKRSSWHEVPRDRSLAGSRRPVSRAPKGSSNPLVLGSGPSS
jgi:hypothetical protein